MHVVPVEVTLPGKLDKWNKVYHVCTTSAKMNLHFSAFFLFAFIIVAINADLGEPCIGMDNNPGTCVNLKQCPELLKLLMKHKISLRDHLAALRIIQQSTCGFVDYDPYVCCPLVNPDVQVNFSQNNKKFQANYQVSQLSEVTDAVSDLSTTTIPDPTSSPSITTIESKISQVSNTPTTLAPTTTADLLTTEQTPEEEILYSKIKERIHEKLKLLPEDCGRILTFKFFYGNRTDIDDFPWTTLIEYDTPSGNRLACGGALISDRYVLTAAHCVCGLLPSWKAIGVRFGEYDISTDIDCLPDGSSGFYCADIPLNVAIEEVIAHSKFEPKNPNRPHDIALLRLAERVSFTDYIKPICLPLVQPIPQRYCTSGWGKNIERNGTSLKYMSYLSLDKPKSCSNTYKSENISISSNQICAGTASTEKPCVGDEGGPLMGIEERPDHMKRVTIFGVLSMTRPSASVCVDSDWPGVYTNVLDHLPWILGHLKE